MQHDLPQGDSPEETLDDIQDIQNESQNINPAPLFTREQGRTLQHNARLYLIVSLMLQCDQAEISLLSEVLATIRAWLQRTKQY